MVVEDNVFVVVKSRNLVNDVGVIEIHVPLEITLLQHGGVDWQLDSLVHQGTDVLVDTVARHAQWGSRRSKQHQVVNVIFKIIGGNFNAVAEQS